MSSIVVFCLSIGTCLDSPETSAYKVQEERPHRTGLVWAEFPVMHASCPVDGFGYSSHVIACRGCITLSYFVKGSVLFDCARHIIFVTVVCLLVTVNVDMPCAVVTGAMGFSMHTRSPDGLFQQIRHSRPRNCRCIMQGPIHMDYPTCLIPESERRLPISGPARHNRLNR